MEDNNIWQNIKVLDLEATLVAEDEIKLPFFRENALRVAMGLSFRDTVCVNRKQDNCLACSLKNLCAYSQVFYLPRSEKSSLGGNSLPYLSYFTAETPTLLPPGAIFKLHLRLLGPAVNYYPYFYFCLENLARKGIGLRNSAGKRGCFVLEKIEAIMPDGQRILAFSRNTDAQLSDPRPFTLADYIGGSPSVNCIRITTLSPLRIKYRNHLDDSLEFHILLRAVLRRISGIYLLANGHHLQLDYPNLIAEGQKVVREETNIHWFDYKRYSTTQHQEMKLGGVVGDVVYRGELTELYPFIKGAEVLAIGKGTAFGFGRFRVRIEEGEEH